MPTRTAPPPTSPSTDTLDGTVELVGVTKTWDSSRAVDNLDLHIEAGEFVSLLGPSGCGKTTTLRMIAGFEAPDSGDITISGRSVVGSPPYKRNVNTVFQAYALFPHMTIAQNIAYGLQQRRTPKSEIVQRVTEALDMVQMRKFADRKPAQLSGGQQQRIALARALVNRPSVLLLDEPLAALDRQLREQMQVELRLLQARLGMTFVFVTHDQTEALAMSDRVAVMRKGRIEQIGPPDAIYAEPVNAYVAGFVGQQNFFDGELTAGGHLRTSFGLLRSEHPQNDSSRHSGPGVAAIRPEHLDISTTEAAPGHDSLGGQLLGTSHLGDTIQYLVRHDGGGTLVVRRPAPNAPAIPTGARVVTSWTRSAARIYPATDLDMDELLVATIGANQHREPSA